jgi:hypothetical protein
MSDQEMPGFRVIDCPDLLTDKSGGRVSVLDYDKEQSERKTDR